MMHVAIFHFMLQTDHPQDSDRITRATPCRCNINSSEARANHDLDTQLDGPGPQQFSAAWITAEQPNKHRARRPLLCRALKNVLKFVPNQQSNSYNCCYSEITPGPESCGAWTPMEHWTRPGSLGSCDWIISIKCWLLNLILETLARVGHRAREQERTFISLDQAAAGGFLVPLSCWQLLNKCLLPGCCPGPAGKTASFVVCCGRNPKLSFSKTSCGGLCSFCTETCLAGRTNPNSWTFGSRSC